MKKLSEQLMEISQRAAAWEKQAAARRQENQEEYEAEVAEARKSVQAAQAEFADRLDSMHDSWTSHWRAMQKSFNDQVAAARSKAAQHKAADTLADAQVAADFQEGYAQLAADFARMAAEEANAAMVDATGARAYAKSLEKTPEKTPEKTTE